MTDHATISSSDPIRSAANPPESREGLLQRLVRHVADQPDRRAYELLNSCGAQGPTLNYGQLWAAAQALGNRLRSKLAPESFVLISTGNGCEFPIAFLACLIADCAAFPVPPTLTSVELCAAAETSRAAAVIGGDDAIAAVHDQVLLTISLSELARPSDPCSPITGMGGMPMRRNDAIGLLLQSSGTSGRPKIVMRSRRSLDAVSHQMVQAIGMGSEDVVLATVPLCHSYGLEHGLLAPLYAGASIRLCASFDLPLVLRALHSGRITVLPSVPSVYEMLANLATPGTAFPSLRAAYSAGGPLPRTVYQKLSDDHGLRVSQLYGATEIGSVTYSHPDDPHFVPGSVGRAMEGVELKIDPTDGQLFVRARSMFAGYLSTDTSSPSPGITGGDKPSSSDGFFPTGDLAALDEHGNLMLTGRLKLLIDVGGLKVNPLEVEEVLLSHPSVGDCVVVPVKQSETISRIKAIVTAAEGRPPPTPDELRQFARERLASYKVPRLVELRATLPRSATGKILRHQVESS